MTEMKQLEKAIKNHPRIDDMKPSNSKDVTVFIRNLLNHINDCERAIEQIKVEFDSFEKKLREKGKTIQQILKEYGFDDVILPPFNDQGVWINKKEILGDVSNER